MCIVRFVVALALTFGTAGAKRWVSLGKGEGTPVRVEVLESNEQRTVLEFEIGGYYEDEVEIDGKTYIRIDLPGATPILERGMPDLPKVARSIIIPDEAGLQFTVLNDDVIEKAILAVAPSKGHFTRDVNPKDVPYVFSEFYGTDKYFPEKPFELGTPYILRDFRGVVVKFNPFQYNSVERKLRIHKHFIVEVEFTDKGTVNIKTRKRGRRISQDFLDIYRTHFINFDEFASKYDLIPEPGRLLVIAYNNFATAVEPLVEWKKQKGIKTKLVLYPDSTGSGATNIKNYIQNEYDTEGVTYVILVGDVDQIPTLYGTYENAPSDPCYVKLEGNDHYPDALISRISAQNATSVSYQVNKFIRYERYPDAGADWYHWGCGIASDEGDPPDWQRADWIRDSLLNYTYTQVDQIYDPGATTSEVFSAVNEGRSILNYIGHGSGVSWGTTGFSVSDVYNLENGYKLPFIIDVACLNGDFTDDECFAEAWLRAGSELDAKGAIGMYASSTPASWVPPCVMQREAVHLLVSEVRNSFGGLAFNGVMKAMDEYAGSGEDVKIMEQYNLFGDCSGIIRTNTPEEMTVSHPGVLFIGSTTYEVDVSGVEGATVALYGDGILYGSSITDATGHATIIMDNPPTIPGILTLTVTAYNKIPYEDEVVVAVPSGPYVLAVGHEIGDNNPGNSDGVVNPGEGVDFNVLLKNFGSDPAPGVYARLSASDPYITITQDSVYYGDIQPDDSLYGQNYFHFDVDLSTPDNQTVSFDIIVFSSDGDTWESHRTITVRRPVLQYYDDLIIDPDSNHVAAPGETIQLYAIVENTGSAVAYSPTATLSMDPDPYVSILNDTCSYADIEPGTTAVAAHPFVIAIDSTCPDPYQVDLYLTITTCNFTSVDTFKLKIRGKGFFDDVESGEGEWTHGGNNDLWHVTDHRSHSATHSWYSGQEGTWEYSDDMDASLVTPIIALYPESKLVFWTYYDLESGYDYGYVEISTDEGATWQQIGEEFNGTSNGWERVEIDLRGYSGAIYIRFRQTSDYAITHEGWYIDDVSVEPWLYPDIAVNPLDINVFMQPDVVDTVWITVSNTGEAPLYFTVRDSEWAVGEIVLKKQTVKEVSKKIKRKITALHYELAKGEPDPIKGEPQLKNHGGPDEFGYTWIDSDEDGGPAYNWIEISSVGIPLELGDDSFAIVNLPFAFNFYGELKTSVLVCSNGYLTFGDDGTDFSNDPIPDQVDPNDLIAVFWDDLNPDASGQVYYYYDEENGRFIVEWSGVPHYYNEGSYTFEVILYPDGHIIMQYKDMMSGDTDEATIGIENADGTDGLQVVYNANYVHDGLAIWFGVNTGWLIEEPNSGTVGVGESMDVGLVFNTEELAEGEYGARVMIISNDPDENAVEVNVSLTVSESFLLGDVNADGVVDYTDLVYLAEYLFGDGPAPQPWASGDVNQDTMVTATDLVKLADIIYSQSFQFIKIVKPAVDR